LSDFKIWKDLSAGMQKKKGKARRKKKLKNSAAGNTAFLPVGLSGQGHLQQLVGGFTKDKTGEKTKPLYGSEKKVHKRMKGKKKRRFVRKSTKEDKRGRPSMLAVPNGNLKHRGGGVRDAGKGGQGQLASKGEANEEGEDLNKKKNGK